jgi:uncharacterized delta-60 repeat protein
MSRRTSSGSVPVCEPLEDRRLLAAGDLDATFGTGGKVLTDLGLHGAQAVAVQEDGKIVAAATGDGFRGFHIVRYNPNGSLDRTFGNRGVASNDMGGADVHAMVVQADGKIILAGSDGRDNLLARHNPNGTLDASFGQGGVVRIPGDPQPPDDGQIRVHWSPGLAVLAMQVDGKILLAAVRGDDFTPTGADVALFRLNPNGQLDPTFGDGGKAQLELGGFDVPRDMAVHANGKIVILVAGYTERREGTSVSSDLRTSYVVRFRPDGTLDTTFGEAGVVTERTTLEQIVPSRLAIGLDGKIFFLGVNQEFNGPAEKFLIRYEADGDRDRKFGGDGKVALELGGNDLLIQPDGKMLISGTFYVNDRRGHDFFARRLNLNGSVDTTYGDRGTTLVDLGDWNFGLASALQRDGGLVIVGASDRQTDPDQHDPNNTSNVGLIRLQGGVGAAGSKFGKLRRGHDQQATKKPKQKGKKEPKKPRAPKAQTTAPAQNVRVVGGAATFAAAGLSRRPAASPFSLAPIDPDE